MASDTPMKLRRHLPGMPAPTVDEEPNGKPGEHKTGARSRRRAVDASPSTLDSAAAADGGDGRTAAVGAERASVALSERRRPAGGEVNPYAGAGTTSLNVRILVPLHLRYRKLVRELEDESYKSSATELFHALLHFGPSNTEEARELLRRWRAVLDADPPQ